MAKRSQPPSAHDVARLAGVSQAAVSRAYNPGSSISEPTRAKVIKAANQLGYRPNLLARSLITGRSGIVGVIIGSPRNPFYLEALDALSEQVATVGLHLLVFTARPETNADEFVEALLRFRVDKLLMMSAQISSKLAEHCRDQGIPVIFFNRRARTAEGFPSVTGANHDGGAAIAEHLFAQGYRRLAYMGGSESSSTSHEREVGFVARVAELGLPAPAKAYGYYNREGAALATRQLLSLDPRPDAIFCANDMMALSAIETAREDFGLRAGRDLGVAGFDDIEGASWRSFDLTTYSQPTEKMIEQLMRLVLDPVSHVEAPHMIVEGELKIRGSTQRR